MLVQENLYSISFELTPTYLLARVKGKKASLTVAKSYWADIIKEATARKPERLLIWEDFPDALSTQETFELVSELCQYTQFLSLRIAFLDEHISQLDRNKLGGMIASNRGFTCCIFTDLAEAEKWLMQSSKTC